MGVLDLPQRVWREEDVLYHWFGAGKKVLAIEQEKKKKPDRSSSSSQDNLTRQGYYQHLATGEGWIWELTEPQDSGLSFEIWQRVIPGCLLGSTAKKQSPSQNLGLGEIVVFLEVW